MKRALSMLVLMVVGCGSGAPEREPQDEDGILGRATQAILSGTVVPSANTGIVQIVYGNTTDTLSSCTGIVVAPEWVLTAAHCFPDSADTNHNGIIDRNEGERSSLLPGNYGPHWTESVDRIVLPPGGRWGSGGQTDAALMHVESAFATSTFPSSRYRDGFLRIATTAPAVGQSMTFFGYGEYAPGSTPDTKLRTSECQITHFGSYAQSTAPDYAFNYWIDSAGTTSVGLTSYGDSGGPAFCNSTACDPGALLGIHNSSDHQTTSTELSVEGFRDWLLSTARPSNDNFANATMLNPTLLFNSEIQMTGSTANATRDGATSLPDANGMNCSCTSSGNVWYRFWLPEDSIVYFDTAGSSYNTAVFVTDDNGNPVPAQGAGHAGLCNDDGGCKSGGDFTSETQSRTAGVLSGGRHYRVSVTGCGTGNFVLHMQRLPLSFASTFHTNRIEGDGTLSGVTAGSSQANGETEVCVPGPSSEFPICTAAGDQSGEVSEWFWSCGTAHQFFSLCRADHGDFTRGSKAGTWDPILYVRSAKLGGFSVGENDDGPAAVDCSGGFDGANVGSRLGVTAPRGISNITVDSKNASGMGYTLRFFVPPFPRADFPYYPPGVVTEGNPKTDPPKTDPSPSTVK